MLEKEDEKITILYFGTKDVGISSRCRHCFKKRHLVDMPFIIPLPPPERITLY